MPRQNERFHPDMPRELERYLIPAEKIIFLVHRHWIVLLEPFLTVFAGFLVMTYTKTALADGGGTLIKVLVVIWFALILRLLYEFTEWHHELFLATDLRLMLVHGLITRKVDIMPMSKVTDMRYDRSLLGQLLGYGVYILESAGQDQALSEIKYIPQPDLHYQQISQVIFAPSEKPLGQASSATKWPKIPITEPDQAWWRRG